MGVQEELEYREELWKKIRANQTEDLIEADFLKRNYVYRGQAGIYRNASRTRSLTSGSYGLAVSVMHTGRTYDDDWTEDGVFFHYPSTQRGGTTTYDDNEIRSLQSLKGTTLFLFAIRHHRSKRIVKKGWVTDYNDSGAWISFIGPNDDSINQLEQEPFSLTYNGQKPRRRKISTISRPRAAKFRYLVLDHFGIKCALSGLDIPELVEAAHICDVGHGGSDHHLNGIPLAVHIHRALDKHLIGIEPVTYRIHDKADGAILQKLNIDPNSLANSRYKPHCDAIEWRWRKFNQP